MTNIFKKSLVFFGWWFIITISKTQPSIIILLYNRYSGNEQRHFMPIQSKFLEQVLTELIFIVYRKRKLFFIFFFVTRK